MAFAVISSDFSYWRKQERPLFEDLIWNIPEQKTGRINVIGGNSQSFHSVVRISEFLTHNFPLREVSTLLPDTLRGQLPPLAHLDFAPSTTSGSFAKSSELQRALNTPDLTLLAGDFSKNSATAVAFSDAISRRTPDLPLFITRDAVDLLAPESERILSHPHIFIIASMLQLQKVFRALYYPRMIMLSQPLIPVIETLHKFTLTYDATILTLHAGHILVAHGGQITSTSLSTTDYSPISLWSGQLAARVAALNLYNPSKPLEATTAAVLYH